MANIFRILWMIVLVLCLAGCGTGSGEGATNGMDEPRELTVEQEELLIKISMDEQRIREGKLYSWQEEILRQYDYAMEYLERKYPSHWFSIVDCHQKNKINSHTTFRFYADGEQKLWDLRLDIPEDGQYIASDNFFCALFAKEYENLLLEYLRGTVPECLGVESTFSAMGGEQYDENLSAATVLEGSDQLTNFTRIYVLGEEGMAEALAGKVRAAIQEKGAYGSYQVRVIAGETGDPLADIPPLYKLGFNVFDTGEGA